MVIKKTFSWSRFFFYAFGSDLYLLPAECTQKVINKNCSHKAPSATAKYLFILFIQCLQKRFLNDFLWYFFEFKADKKSPT